MSQESETPTSKRTPTPTIRDGNWIDDCGACKVCDGEIPHGHTPTCDIWKLEQKIINLERERVYAKTQNETLQSRAALPANESVGVWFQSAVSGLWYQVKNASGDISAVKIDGVIYRRHGSAT